MELCTPVLCRLIVIPYCKVPLWKIPWWIVKSFIVVMVGTQSGGSNLGTNSLCLRLLVSCSLLLIFIHTCVVVHLAYYYCSHFIIIHFRSLLISTSRKLSTSTHNLEELRGEVLEPFDFNSCFE